MQPFESAEAKPAESQAQSFAYDRRSLFHDGLRAGLGLLLTLPPVLFVALHPVVFAIFGGCAGLFLVMLGRAALRLKTKVILKAGWLCLHDPLRSTRSLALASVSGLRLRFYATRRDKADGWFTLDVSGQNATGEALKLSFDSALTDFERLTGTVSAAAFARDLPLDEITEDNLLGLGIVPPSRRSNRSPGLAVSQGE